jgi:RND superfamily putative drug exporter
LGVGVDYALFIVTRYREAMHSGADAREATVTAVATAGRSVLFAGSTVVIAMMGLFVMRQRLLNATAVAASVTVLMTMITAVTLLPALLGFTRGNIDRLRLPYLGRTATRSPMAERWARAIQRRPVLGLVAGAVVMLVLAVPALSMRLSFEDSSTAPHATMAYTACSARMRHDRGGCLLYSGAGGVLPTSAASPVGACRFSAASPIPR